MDAATEKRFLRVQQAARSNLVDRMLEREARIINRLVTAYRSGTLTNEMLHGGIAAIAELRSVASEAEHDVMQATSDAEKLQAGAQNA